MPPSSPRGACRGKMDAANETACIQPALSCREAESSSCIGNGAGSIRGDAGLLADCLIPGTFFLPAAESLVLGRMGKGRG
jgi:hypothetical protein